MPSALATRAVPTLRDVAGGVDTLYLHWTLPIPPAFVRRLEELKQLARDIGRKGNLPSVNLGDELLFVQPNPARAGPYLLKNDVMDVVVNPEPIGPKMPTLLIDLRAFLIAQTGPDGDAAACRAQRIAFDIGGDLATDEQLTPKVTRIDLFIDVQGWSPTAYQLVPRRHKKDWGICNESLFTRAREFGCWIGNRFESADYGTKGSGVSAQIYNKTLQAETDPKYSYIHDVWAKSPNYESHREVDGELVKQDVIRLEFRIRRAGLREFMKEGGIENFSSWEDVRQHLVGLWQYLCTFWLVMRGKRSKSDRLANPVTPFWQQFVDAGATILGRKPTATVLRYHLGRIAKRAIAQMTGCAVQVHACMVNDCRDQRRTFEQNLADIVGAMKTYIRDKEWDVEQRVREKYFRRWAALEHIQLMGETVEEEVAA